MTGPTDATPGAAGRGADEAHAAEHAMLRSALRSTLLLVGALAVLGTAVGALVSGLAGVWGALIGAGVALFFCGATIWSVRQSVGKPPTMMAALVMGTWLAKIVVLMGLLALLRDATFYDRVVLVVVLTCGAIGSALLDYRAVQGSRVPYVQP